VNVRLYVWQRATAVVMVPMVVVHLVVIFWASRHGLTAADVLSRTRGSVAWAAFYGAFVVAAAIHASIGLRTILAEWLSFTGRGRDLAAWLFGATLLVLGLRAVAAVLL
jgi:succinate dehydrogenase subunit C